MLDSASRIRASAGLTDVNEEIFVGNAQRFEACEIYFAMASRTMLFTAILCVACVFQMVNSETAPSGVSISFPPSNKFGCYIDPAQLDVPAKPEDICTVDTFAKPSRLILSYDGGVTSARYQYRTKVLAQTIILAGISTRSCAQIGTKLQNMCMFLYCCH